MSPLRSLSLLSLGLLTACSSPDALPDAPHPYGLDPVPETERSHAVPRPLRVESRRALVVGAIDDATVQPVGAQFEFSALGLPRDATITQTFFYPALATVLQSALGDALRDAGVRASVDHLDLGERVPYPSPPYPERVLVLRASLERFVYARYDAQDVVAAELALRLIEGETGEVVYRDTCRVAVESLHSAHRDPLRHLAGVVAERLLSAQPVREQLQNAPGESTTLPASSQETDQ
ncbi:MAG: hypothetical protein R3F62_12750 [Planctomycetota bacterium]